MLINRVCCSMYVFISWKITHVNFYFKRVNILMGICLRAKILEVEIFWNNIFFRNLFSFWFRFEVILFPAYLPMIQNKHPKGYSLIKNNESLIYVFLKLAAAVLKMIF